MPYHYFDAPESEEYDGVRTLEAFASSPVPTVSRHRSQHMHELCVLVEQMYHTDRRSFKQRRSEWTDVANQLLLHMMKERGDMPAEHRQLLWAVWTRIHHLVVDVSMRNLSIGLYLHQPGVRRFLLRRP